METGPFVSATPSSPPTAPPSFTQTPAPTTPTAGTVTRTKQKKPQTKDGAPSSTVKAPKGSNKGERITFELDDVLRKYSPEQFKTCKAYDVGGVNILNKKPLDSRTALDKIKRRRETHNRVERRRRDCINQLIEELTSLLPKDDDDSQSRGHRVNVLRTAVLHIQNLTQQNEDLTRQLEVLQSSGFNPSPAIVTTLAPTMDYNVENGVQPQWTDTNFSTSHASITSLAPLPRGPTAVSRPASPSPLPSLRDISVTLPSIPTIIEPPESTLSSSSSDPSTNNGTFGTHVKRLNRQTVPRLQLVPPPFHHRRSSNDGVPVSPSHYGQDSLNSPGSTYSGYSSASGPWSSSSSSLGPFSANSSSGPLSSYGGTSPRSPGYLHGLPSPYSSYEPSASTTPTSPSGYSQFHTYPHPSRQNDWNATGHRGVDGDDRSGDDSRDYGASHTSYPSYEHDWQREVGQETSISY